MKKIIFAALILFVFGSCSKNDDFNPVKIRVYNASDFEFQDIEMDPSTGLISFGDIGPNQYSEYQDFEKAYRYAYISVVVNDSAYVVQPIDYVGETPLDKGNYTYRLNFTNDDKLTFGLVED